MRFLGYQCGQETASFRTAIDNRPPAARQRIVDIVPETDGLPAMYEEVPDRWCSGKEAGPYAFGCILSAISLIKRASSPFASHSASAPIAPSMAIRSSCSDFA